MNLINHIYYQLKPFIPRSLQIALRRMVVQGKRKRYSHIWPIDEKAAKPPENWEGWPDGKKFALVLMHDVDTAKGHEKCLDLAQIDEKMGFRSSFNFVPERYNVSSEVRRILVEKGFEVGVHGLKHDGKLFLSREIFLEQAVRINQYLKDWQAVGFVSPSMHRNLDWMHDLNIEYDVSTFDTDPFEPNPEGTNTIFPFFVPATPNPELGTRNSKPEFNCSELVTCNSQPATVFKNGYIELPYTLPQDHTLFVLMQEGDNAIWKKKLDWIAEKGGIAVLLTHPDYMSFTGKKLAIDEYPAKYYAEFLEYINSNYKDQYWNPLPKDLARFWKKSQNYHNPSEIKYNIPSPNPHKACLVYYAKFKSSALLYREAKSLIEKGYDVDVICLRDLEKDKIVDTYHGIKIFYIQARHEREKAYSSYFFNIVLFCFKTAFLLSWLGLKNKYKLIHVTSPPDILVFSTFIPKMLGAKVILDIHDIGPELYMRKLQVSENSLFVKCLKFFEKISIWFSDHVITVTDLWKDRLLSRSASTEKCTVLLNVPDEEVFKPFNKICDNNSKINLYYHGSYEEHFGVDTLLKAMPLIKERITEATLHLFGTGRLKEEFIYLIKEMGMENYVFLNDIVPFYDLPNILKDADIGIVPTKGSTFSDEALSMKSLEYISLGIPIVISNTKVHSYYYKDSMVKFFQAGNPDELARATIEIAENKEERAKLVLNAFKFINEIGWNTTKNKYYEILDKLFNETSKNRLNI